jgi:capsular polysaccharide biosynthesis protein
LYNPRPNNGRHTPRRAKLRPSIYWKATQGESNFSLLDLLRLIQRQVWLILLVTVVCTGVALALTLALTPVYQASVKILVGQEQQTSTPGSLGSDVQGLQKLTDTVAEGANSTPIAEAVIQQLDLQMTPEDLLSNMSARPIRETQFIQIDYRDVSPNRAQLVANTIGEELSKQISDVSPSANAVTAIVWQQAEVPNEPVSPNITLNIIVGLVIGLMLGFGFAFLVRYLDDTWSSREEAEQGQ